MSHATYSRHFLKFFFAGEPAQQGHRSRRYVYYSHAYYIAAGGSEEPEGTQHISFTSTKVQILSFAGTKIQTLAMLQKVAGQRAREQRTSVY